MNVLKEKLIKCYLSKWNQFAHEMINDPVYRFENHPHLLSVTDAFESDWSIADLRIMIFGISTNGWGDKDFDIYKADSGEAISRLMAQYEEFYFEGGNWQYGQAFWNYYYSIEELLRYRLARKVKVIWNNVHKVDASKQDEENRLFNVTKEEIKVFQPDLILVLGLNCANVFHSRISGEEIFLKSCEVLDKTSEERTLLFYDLPNKEFQKLSERLKNVLITYHPNAHGNNAGIKLKLMIDEIVKLFQ